MTRLNKQVFNCKARHGISAALSREFQRAWKERGWSMALEKGNYDLSRQHLNYEIVKGGKIQKIDKSKSMPQRMAEMLAARGIKDPNVGRKVKNVRTVADFIFTGSPEQMHKLAFGDQKVTIRPGDNVENKDVRYTPEFEQWTKDIYNFVAEHWGEENIIGFYVHGDETTPHIHATIVPVKNGKIDYKGVFVGEVNDKITLSRNLSKLHDELAVLNAKYGLERGSSLTGKNSKNMKIMDLRRMTEDLCREKQYELAEMDRELEEKSHDLMIAQRRVKGLTSMITNIEEDKKKLEAELKELQRKLRNGTDDHNALLKIIEGKQKELEDANAKLAEKQEKLEKANEALVAAERGARDAQKTQSDLRQAVDRLNAVYNNKCAVGLKEVYLDKILMDFKNWKATLPPEVTDALKGSFLEQLAERGDDILYCGLLLTAGMIADATTFAEGHGGGGGSDSNLKWGRDDDEDERRWIRRCASKSIHLMRPATKRGRKR